MGRTHLRKDEIEAMRRKRIENGWIKRVELKLEIEFEEDLGELVVKVGMISAGKSLYDADDLTTAFEDTLSSIGFTIDEILWKLLKGEEINDDEKEIAEKLKQIFDIEKTKLAFKLKEVDSDG